MNVNEALRSVVDPEIPSCSIVDLGMIARTHVDDDSIEVDLLPTFIGCPARHVIGEDVRSALNQIASGRRIQVEFVLDPPWTTDRVTDAGKAALKEYGISPDASTCPYCGSTDTKLESAFGPTPCRSTNYCNACRNVFEGFKEKSRRLPIR